MLSSTPRKMKHLLQVNNRVFIVDERTFEHIVDIGGNAVHGDCVALSSKPSQGGVNVPFVVSTPLLSRTVAAMTSLI